MPDDILTEIRVWGARHVEPHYWGASSYVRFVEELASNRLVTLDSGTVLVVSYEEPDDYSMEESGYQTLDVQLVFKTADGSLYAYDGEYSSWNGMSWDGAPYAVEPQPIQKIEYVRKRK